MPDIDEVLREELTSDQYDAATDAASSILTLACAGSGKSRTLAYRIAWLIDQGADPSSIIAFTFTEKAADSIQLRVANALRKGGFSPTVLGRIYIGTIHSYCREILGRVDAGYRQYEVLDSNRLKLYLMSRYPQLGINSLRRRASGERYFQTIQKVADCWVVANDEVLDLEVVEGLDPELGACLRLLSERLDADRFIDFSLMVRRVVDALRGGRAEGAIAGIQHLLVDEYQDINPVQEQLIRELYTRAGNLMVLGDDDQAVYGWRGADVGQIVEFQTRHPGCTRHTLSRNFRSTEAIVEAADHFIAQELGPQRMTKGPVAQNPDGPRDFRRLWFPDRPTEAEWVIDQLEALCGTEYVENDGSERGLTPGDFAILMRSTRGNEQDDSARHSAFTKRLEERGIPYSLEQGGGVFERPEVAAIRETFELLRHRSPTREEVEAHLRDVVRPAFPHADSKMTMRVLGEWGRLVHTPTEVERRRIYPQRLLHELLAAFGMPNAGLDEGALGDLGVLSRMLQDVETVYVSIDTAGRFQSVLNFLQQVAEDGYDSSTTEVLRRPDAVTVSTVHRVKGLEFPCVFVVDVENQRFPMKRQEYGGWLPEEVMRPALDRGAYGNDREQEARLFYTALTRAERYLYVTGAEQLPAAKKPRKQSPFAARLEHSEIGEASGRPEGLSVSPPKRRLDETIMPTTFSEIRYYLRCPRDYQYRQVWGFSPPITEMFGFGQTVHAAVGKLHETHTERAPTVDEAESVAREIFHLKHVPRSSDPMNRPGAYEGAEESAVSILCRYSTDFVDDFSRERQVEVSFEVPVRRAVINGTIDLLLRYDHEGELIDASVVDFKAMEGGPEPVRNDRLDWTELSLQVQLYAKAARDVLGEPARTGAVHLLKDGQRVEVPVDEEAVEAAVGSVEWAVDRVIEGEFPMRPHPDKCSECDWQMICPQEAEEFQSPEHPPELHLPEPRGSSWVRAFSEYVDVP